MSVRWYGIKGHDLQKTMSWRTGSWSWPVTGVVSDPCQGFDVWLSKRTTATFRVRETG